MEIEQGGLLRLGGAQRVVIGCIRGVLWVTEEGDPLDHLVHAGARHRVRGRGLVDAEALIDSALWVCLPVRALAQPARSRSVRPSGMLS